MGMQTPWRNDALTIVSVVVLSGSNGSPVAVVPRHKGDPGAPRGGRRDGGRTEAGAAHRRPGPLHRAPHGVDSWGSAGGGVLDGSYGLCPRSLLPCVKRERGPKKGPGDHSMRILEGRGSRPRHGPAAAGPPRERTRDSIKTPCVGIALGIAPALPALRGGTRPMGR